MDKLIGYLILAAFAAAVGSIVAGTIGDAATHQFELVNNALAAT